MSEIATQVTRNIFQVLSNFIEETEKELVNYEKIEKDTETKKLKEIFYIYLGMLQYKESLIQKKEYKKVLKKIQRDEFKREELLKEMIIIRINKV